MGTLCFYDAVKIANMYLTFSNYLPRWQAKSLAELHCVTRGTFTCFTRFTIIARLALTLESIHLIPAESIILTWD